MFYGASLLYHGCFPLRKGLEEIREDGPQPPQELKRQSKEILWAMPGLCVGVISSTNISDNEQNLPIFPKVTR